MQENISGFTPKLHIVIFLVGITMGLYLMLGTSGAASATSSIGELAGEQGKRPPGSMPSNNDLIADKTVNIPESWRIRKVVGRMCPE